MENLKYASSNIKLLLKYKEWTQAILCKKTGITPVTLTRRLASGIPKWTMLEAVSISKALGFTMNDIFFTCMVPNSNKDDESKKGA